MLHRDFRSARLMALVPAEGPSGAAGAPAGSPSSMTPPSAPTESGVMSAPAPTTKPHVHHASTNGARAPEIEPAQARLKVLQDAPVYSAPAKTSKHIEPSAVEVVKPTDKVFVLAHDAGVLDKPNRWAKKLAEVHQSHNVHVIGIALNYVQIRMKSGLEGFVPLTALE